MYYYIYPLSLYLSIFIVIKILASGLFDSLSNKAFYFMHPEYYTETAGTIYSHIWHWLLERGSFPRVLKISGDNHSTIHNNAAIGWAYWMVCHGFVEEVEFAFFIEHHGSTILDRRHRELYTAFHANAIFTWEQMLSLHGSQLIVRALPAVYDWQMFVQSAPGYRLLPQIQSLHNIRVRKTGIESRWFSTGDWSVASRFPPGYSEPFKPFDSPPEGAPSQMVPYVLSSERREQIAAACVTAQISPGQDTFLQSFLIRGETPTYRPDSPFYHAAWSDAFEFIYTANRPLAGRAHLAKAAPAGRNGRGRGGGMSGTEG